MKRIYLRKAEYKDLDLLFKWANDPAVRNNSFKSELIPYESHVNWFNQMMEDELVVQFILMNENTPVGQIRLSIMDAEAEIGYSVAAEYRGKGYGHIILELVANIVSQQYPSIKKLIAKVKPDNEKSNRLFQSGGYKMMYSCYELDIY